MHWFMSLQVFTKHLMGAEVEKLLGGDTLGPGTQVSASDFPIAPGPHDMAFTFPEVFFLVCKNEGQNIITPVTFQLHRFSRIFSVYWLLCDLFLVLGSFHELPASPVWYLPILWVRREKQFYCWQLFRLLWKQMLEPLAKFGSLNETLLTF